VNSIELAQFLFEIQNAGSAPRPWTLENFKSELEAPESELFLWQDEGFVLFRKSFEEAWIFNIAVRRKGQGLGSRLLEAFLSEVRAKHREIERVGLEVAAKNAAARRLYAKVGFKEIASRKAYYSDGDDALLLTKCLTSPSLKSL
jgi:ribosomal-protein-alanine N-acetyltransferase